MVGGGRTGEQKWYWWTGGTFNGDSAIGRREKNVKARSSSAAHTRAMYTWTNDPLLYLSCWTSEREREGGGAGNELTRADETEAREGGEDLPARYCGTYLEVCRCRATLTAPLIGWCPLGPPESAPRIPGEQRARILFEVALPSLISRVAPEGGRIQLALKTNTSNWPRIRDTHFVD